MNESSSVNYEHLIFKRVGRSGVITLNRPEVHNCINGKLWWEIGTALEEINNDPDLWVAIITAAGERSFCAGQDLKELAAGGIKKTPEMENWGWGGIVRHYINKPVIAAVNGFSFGGGTEICLACDLVVAAEHAQFGLPEVKRGLFAAAGGLLRLPRQIPQKVAAYYIFTGDPISAQEALKWGLINQVVPKENLMDAALKLAEKICENSPSAIRACKEVIYKALDMTIDYPPRAWELSAEVFAEKVRNTEDFKEGPRAFAEKRKPNWTGR